ncbi:hypothetical protein HK101_011728 [Irineochytrium annulatum]|nr:hypothetical protein HK101_011728 [Irineochytrium annulatum]
MDPPNPTYATSSQPSHRRADSTTSSQAYRARDGGASSPPSPMPLRTVRRQLSDDSIGSSSSSVSAASHQLPPAGSSNRRVSSSKQQSQPLSPIGGGMASPTSYYQPQQVGFGGTDGRSQVSSAQSASASEIRRNVEMELAKKRRSSTRGSQVGSERGYGGGSQVGPPHAYGGSQVGSAYGGGGGHMPHGGSRSVMSASWESTGAGEGGGGPMAGRMSPAAHKRQHHKPKRGTVAAMHPTPAVALHEDARVVEAAAHMAAKRVDAVLIVDKEGHLSGILTDKDMAFRVVAEGLDPKTTLVSTVMTHNPVSVVTTGSASDALNKMVAGHFRHLPVIEDNDDPDDPGNDGGVVAVLDITKCLYDALEKLDRVYEQTHHRLETVSNAQSAQSVGSQGKYAALLKENLGFPDLSSLLQAQSGTPPVVGLNDTVFEAARRMRAGRETAALVFDSEAGATGDGLGDLSGIFTSKDLVLRVLAAGLDPTTTLVHRVMTPHPDCVTPETPVIDALRKMHAGRYLHLPVVDNTGVVEGLVDVLKLTYTTLEQLGNVAAAEGGAGLGGGNPGAVWDRFWDASSQLNSNPNDSDDEVGGGDRGVGSSSRAGGSQSGRSAHGGPHRRKSSNFGGRGVGRAVSDFGGGLRNITSPSPSNESVPDDSTVLPDDSASRVAGPSDQVSPTQPSPSRPPILLSRGGAAAGGSPQRGGAGAAPADGSFTFKLKDLDTGKIHRIVCPPILSTLTRAVLLKLGSDHPRLPSNPSQPVALSYLDDEGDVVHLASDADLEEAVAMARAVGWRRVMLCLDAQVVAVGLGRFLGGSSVVSFQTGAGGPPSESDAGSWRADVNYGGDNERGAGGGSGGRKRDLEGLVAPILVGTGVAIVCAFLLGRAFR